MFRKINLCERNVLRICGTSLRNEKRFSSEVIQKPSYIHRVGQEPLKFMTIGQFYKKTVNAYPDKIAVISCMENKRITYAEALDKIDKFASGLLSLGLSTGDRVAVFAPNYEFWYISKLAIARAGLICVAMNPGYQLPEVDFCLKKVNVKAAIVPESFKTQKYHEMFMTLIPSLKHSKTTIEGNNVNSLKHLIVYSDKQLPGAINFNELLQSASESDAAEIEKLQSSINPDSGCNIQFTSGTTGQPKAALVSHFSVLNVGLESGARVDLDKVKRRICVNLPFFHIAGIMSIMHSMGSTLVLPSPHFSGEHTLQTIVKEKCDVIYGTPNMYVDLVAKQKKMSLDLPKIVFSVVGGAICTPKLVQDVKKYLNIHDFRSSYGMTETCASGFQSMSGEDEHTVLNYVGHVSENIEVKVVDNEGKVVPFGTPGELCIRGYCTMLGYWEDEAKTKEAMGADGWLKTGDQFVLYENGYGKIVGRLKEMIIRGGENLFPREIEDFLNTHPSIREAHVIGLPDERMGEEVAAFIKLKDPSKTVTHSDIKDFCKGKISHFKVPRYVVTVEKFPRTISGKVQKNLFPEHFADQIKLLH